MAIRRIITLCLLLGIVSGYSVFAQQSSANEEALIKQRLEWFQNLKFGFMVHWGPYSQWGVVESWGLCLDLPKIRTENWNSDINVYRKAYWRLNETFYPMEFDPFEWVQLAKEAGMKYFIPTTKHHDGFCMYDTKLTDYKITGPDCPFSMSPQPDVVGRLVDAFRREGFGLGLYFSKADWHSPYFWKPGAPAPDRNANYDVEREPERWQMFVDFVQGQIKELMTQYGKIDILWLDSGWIRPSVKNQDIQMDRIAKMSRSYQPGLLIVDRTVGGKYENYKTPEKQIPDKPLDTPWETCMTMGDAWSFKPYDNYKSTRVLIHMLVDVVAKGGNFMLNVGPMPNGKLPPPAIQRMKEMGQWMKINGEAIYATRPIAPYKEQNICLTRKRNFVYAIFLEEGEDTCPERQKLPESIQLQSVKPVSGSEIHLLGVEKALEWRITANGIHIEIPQSVSKSVPCDHAYVFRIKVSE